VEQRVLTIASALYLKFPTIPASSLRGAVTVTAAHCALSHLHDHGIPPVSLQGRAVLDLRAPVPPDGQPPGSGIDLSQT
jgi:hypothetical protein